MKKQHGPRKDSFPLPGLLRCGRCGAPMGGATSQTVSGKDKRYVYRRYVCSTAREHGRHACGNQSIPEDRLLPFLVNRLRNVSLAPNRLEGLRRTLREKFLAQHQSAPEQAERLRGGIADAEIVRGRRNLFPAEDPLTF